MQCWFCSDRDSHPTELNVRTAFRIIVSREPQVVSGSVFMSPMKKFQWHNCYHKMSRSFHSVPNVLGGFFLNSIFLENETRNGSRKRYDCSDHQQGTFMISLFLFFTACKSEDTPKTFNDNPVIDITSHEADLTVLEGDAVEPARLMDP